MSVFKCFSLSVICVSLIACGSSGSSDPAIIDDNTNDNANYNSKYCVSDFVVTESDDVFVSFDAFLVAPDLPPSIDNADSLDAVIGLSLYSSLLTSIVNINSTIGVAVIDRALCAAEEAADNQCNLIAPGENGGTQFVGSVSASVLTFDTFIKSAGSTDFDLNVSSFSGNVDPYWQGTYTLFVDPVDSTSVETEMTWRRDASQEVFSASSSNGDFMNATELSDCSGVLSTRITDEGGTVRTVDGSWQINGTTTTGEVTRCVDSDCNNISW